jgi:hypothetical protein
MLQMKIIKKIKHILCSITFFSGSPAIYENVKKYGTARQVTDDNITLIAFQM